MLFLLSLIITEPLRAEIKIENYASKYIADYSGFKLQREENGILYYEKPAIDKVDDFHHNPKRN